MIATSSHKSLPDFFSLGGFLVVTERFREIVERLEPQTHQFLGVKLFKEKGLPIEGPRFFLNVFQKVDALVIEESNVEWIDHPETTSPHLPGRILPAFRSLHRGPGPLQLVLSRQAIGTRHLWRGDRYFSAALFCSDQLLEAIAEANLKLLRAEWVEER